MIQTYGVWLNGLERTGVEVLWGLGSLTADLKTTTCTLTLAAVHPLLLLPLPQLPHTLSHAGLSSTPYVYMPTDNTQAIISCSFLSPLLC